MNEYARRMMMGQHRHPYHEYPEHEYEREHEHEGGGNKYFIYRDGAKDMGMRRDKRESEYDYGYMGYHGEYYPEYRDRRSEKPYGRPNYERDFMGDERERQYDYAYADNRMVKLTKKDIKHWEMHLENADGTDGKKYSKDLIIPAAQQHGIKFHDYSEDEFAMAVNMLYSDYCKAIGGDMMLYIKMAKAFLEDEDFEGTGSEKLALYYRCIVEHDEE